MRKIRDASTIIGLLENGQFNPALSNEIGETLHKLSEMSEENPVQTFKGTTTVKLNFSVKDGMVTIGVDMDSKTPKRPRKNSVFWVVEDGALSTEHPRQHDMFATRAVPEAPGRTAAE